MIELFNWIINGLFVLLITAIGWGYNVFRKSLASEFEKINQELTVLEAKVDHVQTDIDKNYYDKAEVLQHWDMLLTPLKESMVELSSAMRLQAAVINEIHQDMAILKYKILGEIPRKSENDQK